MPDHMLFLSLLYNIALLVALILVHSLLLRRLRRRGIAIQVVAGLLFGSVALVGMLTPVQLQPGVIFDGRSIVLAAAGLFGGLLPAAIAAALTACYRLWLGGAGAVVGTAVIVEAAAFGVLFHHWRRRRPQIVRPGWLYLFGLLVHAVMVLLLLFGLPAAAAAAMLQRIALPVMLLYPPATLLVCRLFLEVEAREADAAALRESEERYRTLFEEAHDGIALADVDTGEIIDCNKKLAAMVERPKSELVGRSQKVLHPPGDLDGNATVGFKRKVADPARISEAQLVTRDGRRIDVEIRASRVELNGRQALLGIFRDISARKQTEEELRHSRERYHTFISQSHEAIYCTEFDHPIDTSLPVEEQIDAIYENAYMGECNLAMARMYGIESTEAFAGRRLVDFHGGKDNPVNRAGFRSFIRSGYWVADIETEETLPGGEKRYFQSSDMGILADGRLVRIWGTAQDITARKRTEEELKRANERFTLAARAAGLGVWDWDIVRNALVWDDRMYEMYGVSRDKFQGAGAYEAWLNGIHPDDRARNDEISRQARAGEREYETEFRVVWPDGSVHHIQAYGLVLRDAAGLPVRMTGINFDITALKQAEAERSRLQEQLLKAEKMASLGILAAGVAHEINNPNNFITFNLDIVADLWRDIQPALAAWQQQHGDLRLAGLPYATARERIPAIIEGMADGARRIRDIVYDLKEYALPDVTGMDGAVAVNDTVQAAVKLMQSEIKKSAGRFDLDLAAGLPAVRGSARKLEQVLINLLHNACQAQEGRPGAISVRSRHDAARGEVQVLVGDEGPGMDEEALKRLGDPFFTTRQDRGGTGLGISICRRILHDHGGRLEFESRPGAGTTAVVILPARP